MTERDEVVLLARAGSRLRRVDYVNLPDANWQLHGQIHSVDFGLVLSFEDAGSVGLIWETALNGGIRILDGDLSPEVTDAVIEDASHVSPWKEAVGRRLVGVHWGMPGDRGGMAERCAVRLDFEAADSVYVLTADMTDDGAYLTPCSDTVVVMSDAELRRFVAEDRVNHLLETGWVSLAKPVRVTVLMGASMTVGGLVASALWLVRRLLRRRGD